MTTLEESQYGVGTAVADRRRRRRPDLGGTWWRHVVGIVAMFFALFPVVYVVSAAFNPIQALGGSSLIPDDVTLGNFRTLFDTESDDPDVPTAHYLRWYANSLIVPGTAAFFSVMFGAFAAYAFSRFRFKGRRIGMLALLLIQMFPQFLALVAIYLILLHTGDVFPNVGLNTLTGLILVYLGGAMGVNAWLMKGFFDTIPSELDESARVDGATPAQVFWGVILPLAAPVLAVVALISFVFTLNEFVIASAVLQTTDNFTLPVGLRGFIDKQYQENWGPFAAGVLLAAIPVVVLFLALQKFIVHGLTQGSVKG
ncbi:MAG: sugar ABC transporter permease [Thermoleophilia bacterium]|nr:sugar ABC transporter permease [Thermoleophilia bacterium]